MIEFKNVCFNYENEIIFENFSKVIETNKITTIIGQSGAGKTTLINILTGFELPVSGSVLYDGVELNCQTINKIRKQIACLPQNFNIPVETVEDLFFTIFNLKNNKKNKPNKIVLLDYFLKLGLEKEIFEKKIDEISGGQKQRVILSSLLLSKKKYLILDEPSSALDELSTKKILQEFRNKPNITTIIASHDKTIVENSDFIIDLNKK
jgi:putative ABC transport system ATP-binding protein